jgi:hypothetical protein
MHGWAIAQRIRQMSSAQLRTVLCVGGGVAHSTL